MSNLNCLPSGQCPSGLQYIWNMVNWNKFKLNMYLGRRPPSPRSGRAFEMKILFFGIFFLFFFKLSPKSWKSENGRWIRSVLPISAWSTRQILVAKFLTTSLIISCPLQFTSLDNATYTLYYRFSSVAQKNQWNHCLWHSITQGKFSRKLWFTWHRNLMCVVWKMTAVDKKWSGGAARILDD